MTRYVGFIRAIMIGREGLTREVVVGAFTDAGATDVRSHLTTGNVSFDAGTDRVAAVVDAASDAMSAVKGKEVPIFLRELEELAALPLDEIFAAAPVGYDYAKLVSFLPDDAPDIELPLYGKKEMSVVFRREGRELFSVTRMVDGDHSDPGGLIQRRLGRRITTRAVGSIHKILAAHDL